MGLRYRRGERVERRNKTAERGRVIATYYETTSYPGGPCVLVLFDAGYQQLNLTADLRRPKRKEAVTR